MLLRVTEHHAYNGRRSGRGRATESPGLPALIIPSFLPSWISAMAEPLATAPLPGTLLLPKSSPRTAPSAHMVT